MVGLHTVDAPLQHANQNARHFGRGRQSICQAFLTMTPTKLPGILNIDAKQNAKQMETGEMRTLRPVFTTQSVVIYGNLLGNRREPAMIS
jgi:hypothetical protein